MDYTENLVAIVETVSLILAIIALVYAARHVKEIRSTAKRLEDVQRSLSTRYIGQFPEFFPEIVNLLKTANHEITILCDVPAYASFSNPRTWLDYQQTLEKKVQEGEVKITLTCLAARCRTKSVIDQFFKGDEDWEQWKKRNAERLHYVLSSRRETPRIEDLSKEQLLELFESIEQRTLEETFATADVREIETYIPVYFWLADGMRAVFAIHSERTVEYGFSTTDQKLIAALVEMGNEYHHTVVKTT